jgi:exopolysaccharide production protein ExoY
MKGPSSEYSNAATDDTRAYSTIDNAANVPKTMPPPSPRRAKVAPLHRQWRGKRILDILGTLFLGILFSPIIVFVTIWLFVTRGPILFGHTRIGQGGNRFTCYKFRTMVPDAERELEKLFKRAPELHAEWVLHHKLKDDPRITRIGWFLRRTSLDELPQLWNVLKGDMSLVGPRPIVQEEIFRYGRAIRHYMAVKPGITGLWQVSGRNDIGYCRRVALDRAYAMRSSLRLDLWILMQTVPVIAGQRGAY